MTFTATYHNAGQRLDVAIVPEGGAYSAHLHVDGAFRGEIAYRDHLIDTLAAVNLFIDTWYPAEVPVAA